MPMKYTGLEPSNKKYPKSVYLTLDSKGFIFKLLLQPVNSPGPNTVFNVTKYWAFSTIVRSYQ